MSYNYNEGRTLSLKVVMNKEKTKVLFAEASTNFINVLLSFLALPLGKVVKIIDESCGAAAVPGSLSTLYRGASALDEAYFSVGGAKAMLLDPHSSLRADLRRLPLDISSSPPNEFFACWDSACRKSWSNLSISLYSDIATCACGKPMTSRLMLGEAGGGAGGGAADFTVSPLSFVITDDLRVAPLVTIQTLSDLGITDTPGAEITYSSFGISEIRKLLMLSLTSATPLTDLILKKTGLSSAAVKPEPGILLHNIQKNDLHSPKKLDLKVCLQKSTNRFLFAEGMDDFIEFLFSFLIIPSGGVEFLLKGNAGLKCIDNLYESVSTRIDKKYFTTSYIKDRLINPYLPHGYGSVKQFLPLTEVATYPVLYYDGKRIGSRYEKANFNDKGGAYSFSTFKSSKEFYVRKGAMCFVKDDLSVSPSLDTGISILSGLGIPLSDVKVVELQIGMEEALSILKASLTSKTALTDALAESMRNKLSELERKPKQEP